MVLWMVQNGVLGGLNGVLDGADGVLDGSNGVLDGMDGILEGPVGVLSHFAMQFHALAYVFKAVQSERRKTPLLGPPAKARGCTQGINAS